MHIPLTPLQIPVGLVHLIGFIATLIVASCLVLLWRISPKRKRVRNIVRVLCLCAAIPMAFWGVLFYSAHPESPSEHMIGIALLALAACTWVLLITAYVANKRGRTLTYQT